MGESPSKIEQPLVGVTIGGQYQVIEVLGQGGMGTVYRGVQLSVGRPVAIKVLSRDVADDEEAVQRFQREAVITSRLTHPNSIRLFDFGLTDEGLFYLVMELLEGRELSKVLEEDGPFSVKRATAVLIQVLKSLREAHQLGVVHRDLKPDNIFLRDVHGERDVVKVMDFGIAKAVSGEAMSTLTQAGVLIGTPTYMSPEQARGEKVDARADLYSLGVILHQLLAGEPPFDSEKAVTVLVMHVTQPPPRLTASRPGLQHRVAAQEVIDTLMAKQADLRPAGAAEALRLMQQLQASAKGDAPETLDPDDPGPTAAFDAVEADGPIRGTRAYGSASTEVAKPAQPDKRPDTDVGPAAKEPLPPTVEAQMVLPPEPTPTPAAEVPIAQAEDRLPWLPIVLALAIGFGGLGFFFLRDRIAKTQPAPQATVETIAKEAPKEPDPLVAPAASAKPAVAAAPVVLVQSVPPGAAVLADNTRLGVTPLEVKLPAKGKSLSLELRLSGRKSATLVLRADTSGEQVVPLERKPARKRAPKREEGAEFRL